MDGGFVLPERHVFARRVPAGRGIQTMLLLPRANLSDGARGQGRENETSMAPDRAATSVSCPRAVGLGGGQRRRGASRPGLRRPEERRAMRAEK